MYIYETYRENYVDNLYSVGNYVKVCTDCALITKVNYYTHSVYALLYSF